MIIKLILQKNYEYYENAVRKKEADKNIRSPE